MPRPFDSAFTGSWTRGSDRAQDLIATSSSTQKHTAFLRWETVGRTAAQKENDSRSRLYRELECQ